MQLGASGIIGKRVTVLGAARSGVAIARLLSKKGASVFVSEKAPLEMKQEQAGRLEAASIPYEFGEHTPRILEADLCVLSPGIPVSSPVVEALAGRNIPIVGELEASSWFCRSPIVAVTGSNGKSTATALLGKIFEADGRPCVVAGNIGQPFSRCVEKIGSDGVAVLEVSSFQLETVHTFRPRVAVFLNLTPDHLDRHGSMEVYGSLKARLFENQTADDFAVVKGSDKRVLALTSHIKSRITLFGVRHESLDSGFVQDDVLKLRLADVEEYLMPVSEMGLRGEHNVENALAAALASRLMGVKGESIDKALREFEGLPHRMERVRRLRGVLWVNDSKATNVDSVWYALGSYSEPIVWIAGGRDKDSDFSALRRRVKDHVRFIILLGEAADKMATSFEGIKPITRVGSLEEAVEEASNRAETGNVVLLSPGCASFDMFRDFEQRGDRFKALVRQL